MIVGKAKLEIQWQGSSGSTVHLSAVLIALCSSPHSTAIYNAGACYLCCQDAALYTYQRTLDIRFAKEEAPRTFREHKLRGAAFIGENVMLPTNGHDMS